MSEDQVKKALDPYTDGSNWGPPPELNNGMLFRDVASFGLRQYGGWIRDEFLNQLQGLQAARVWREMWDNSPTVGAIIFAITQAMRKVEWRTEPASDKPEAQAEAEFADSLRNDLSHTWEDHQTEVLTMLVFGFSLHEIVYKRRLGLQKDDSKRPSSNYNDGRIGWRRLPIRGQETILKWFLDQNGQVQGFTQQPYIGTLIDLSIRKALLFRPSQFKNNPEGRSILRPAFRPYYFIKRLEELEAILLERMGGLPVVYAPNELLVAAQSGSNAAATAQLNSLKNLVRNVRIDEQMGVILPSDLWPNQMTGQPSTQRMYEFQLVTPQGRGQAVKANEMIERYKLDIMSTVLADFIKMGHEVRGTNNLAVTKVDMFYAAIEGWLNANASVYNRYALPRVWDLNRLDRNLMPKYVPDMAQRMDLDSLGSFIANLANAGFMTPDDDLETFLRDAAGLPDLTEEQAYKATNGNTDVIKRMLLGAFARHVRKMRGGAVEPKTT